MAEFIDVSPLCVRPFDFLEEGRIVNTVTVTEISESHAGLVVTIESSAVAFVGHETGVPDAPIWWDIDRGADYREDTYRINDDDDDTRLRIARDVPIGVPPS